MEFKVIKLSDVLGNKKVKDLVEGKLEGKELFDCLESIADEVIEDYKNNSAKKEEKKEEKITEDKLKETVQGIFDSLFDVCTEDDEPCPEDKDCAECGLCNDEEEECECNNHDGACGGCGDCDRVCEEEVKEDDGCTGCGECEPPKLYVVKTTIVSGTVVRGHSKDEVADMILKNFNDSKDKDGSTMFRVDNEDLVKISIKEL